MQQQETELKLPCIVVLCKLEKSRALASMEADGTMLNMNNTHKKLPQDDSVSAVSCLWQLVSSGEKFCRLSLHPPPACSPRWKPSLTGLATHYGFTEACWSPDAQWPGVVNNRVVQLLGNLWRFHPNEAASRDKIRSWSRESREWSYLEAPGHEEHIWDCTVGQIFPRCKHLQQEHHW